MCVLLGDRNAGVWSRPLRIKETTMLLPHSCLETFIVSSSLCPASAVNFEGKKPVASHHTSKLGFTDQYQ